MESKDRIIEEQEYYIHIFWSILLSTVLILAVVFEIYNHLKFIDHVDYNLARNIYTVAGFSPENTEKISFMFGLIFYPISIYFLNKFFIDYNKKHHSGSNALKIVYMKASPFIMIIVASAILYFDVKESDFFLKPFYSVNFSTLLSLIFLITMSAILYYTFIIKNGQRFLIDKALRLILYTAGFIVIVSTSMAYIFGINGKFLHGTHFDAVFYSVVQVYLGKALLVDLISQYGLYPQLLEPLFKILGLSVLKFTLVMAILIALSMLNIFIFLLNVTKTPLIALSGLITILFFYSKLFNSIYFQYLPIRTIFPTLLLVLAWYFFNNKNKKFIYYSSFFIYSIAILWNMETGIVVFLTWLIALGYKELLDTNFNIAIKRISQHIILGLLIFSTVFAAYNCYIYIRYGNIPEFAKFLEYQKMFYFLGFYALRMKLIHPWNVVILIYMIALSYSAKSLITKDNAPKTKLVFTISILGAGLFSYYQWRSHDNVLELVAYPALILATICVDDLFLKFKEVIKGNRRKSSLETLTFLILIIFIMLSNISMIGSFNIVKNFGDIDVTSIDRCDYITNRTINLIKNYTTPEDKTLILSCDGRSGLFYLETHNSNPLKVPGCIELFLKEDRNKIVNFLEDNDTNNSIVIATNDIRPLGDVVTALLNHYKIIDYCDGTYIFKRGGSGKNILLEKKKDEVFHYLVNYKDFQLYSTENGFYFINDDYPKIKLGSNFTIEIIVKPYTYQNPYACIIGNHLSGVNGIEGFVIQQDGYNRNNYSCYIFGGKEFDSVKFRLDENTWNYLVVSIENKKIGIYKDGQLIASKEMKGFFKNSGLPLSVGNWIGKDRPFNGQIKEIKITNNTMREKEIISKWRKIRQAPQLEQESSVNL